MSPINRRVPQGARRRLVLVAAFVAALTSCAGDSTSAADATVLSSNASARLGASARSRQFTLVAGNYRFVVQAINVVGTGPTSNRSNNVVPR